MKPRRRHIAAPLAAAALLLPCAASPALAARWRDGFSRPAMLALNRLTACAPFPVAEPLVLAAAGCALLTLAAALVRSLAQRKIAPLARWLRGMLRACLILGGIVALLWAPVKLSGIAEAPAPPDAERLEALCAELADALKAGSGGFPEPQAALRRVPEVAGMPGCAVKAARYPEWMRAMGIAGLFAPPTGEAIVDASAPSELMPFTAVHEMMHLNGIADEGEANIAAWQRCLDAGGEFAESARLWALRYAMGMLRRADESAWRRARQALEGTPAARFCGGTAETATPLRLWGSGNYAALVSWLVEKG